MKALINKILELSPLLIILIILLVFAILIVLKFLFIKIDIFYKRLKCKRKYFNTLSFFNNFGCVFGVGGKIGAGKTTLLSLLCNIFNISCRMKLQTEMQEIKNKLTTVPFNKLEIEFRTMLFESGQTFDQALKKLIAKYQDDFLLKEYHYDYLNYIERLKLLSDYFYYYYHFLKDNHVMSNIKVYDHSSGTYSYMYQDDYIKLKENNPFPIDNYTFIFNDEGALTNSNKNSITKLNEDSGTDVFDRLCRNASGGTIYKATSTQDVTRLQKLEREIMTNVIYVFSHELVGISKLYLKTLERRMKLVNFVYSIVLKIKKDLFFEDSENYFRRRIKSIQDKLDKHVNTAFIKYDVGIYNDSEIAGKAIPDDDLNNYYCSLVGPVNYAWGSVDSYSFSSLFDYLRERSSISPGEQGRSDLDYDYIKKILEKQKKAGSVGYDTTESVEEKEFHYE